MNSIWVGRVRGGVYIGIRTPDGRISGVVLRRTATNCPARPRELSLMHNTWHTIDQRDPNPPFELIPTKVELMDLLDAGDEKCRAFAERIRTYGLRVQASQFEVRLTANLGRCS